MENNALNERIRHFYDASSDLWLKTWGEHMHHGYYGPNGDVRKAPAQAQEDLIRELIEWADVERPKHVFDAGCGVGGSARFLAEQYGCSVLGVTLSPVQANAAANFNERAGLADKVKIEVGDLLGYGDRVSEFDLIWSMESAEHIADKKGMLNMFYELLRPGGKLVLATWCHRPLPPELNASEEKLLSRVYSIYNLPPMNSIRDYKQLAAETGFTQVKTDDWSDAVAPFWREVIRTALIARNFNLLMRSSWSTVRGAWAMRYMQKGYRRGLIRFVVLTGVK